ncbi:MAG: hypothetical protein WC806_02820 [Candidatus Gracilibacteria bacterium]|jgi:hypothetical protein
MKKILKGIFEAVTMFTILFVALQINALAATANLPLNNIDDTNKNSVYQMYENAKIPLPPGAAEGNVNSEIVINSLFDGALSYTKAIMAVVGILYLAIIAYKLIIQGGDEENVKTQKKAITYTLIAFAIISMSGELARMLDISPGNSLLEKKTILNRVYAFDKLVEVFMTFIRYIIGAYATFMVLRSSLKLIVGGGNDEETGKEKKSILYSSAGLFLIYVGQIFINKVFYIVDKNKYTGFTGVQVAVNTVKGIKEVIGLTNFMVSFMAPVAVLMLLVSALLWVTAAGNDEQIGKAKRVLTTTIVGMVIIFGAFAVVNTAVVGQFEQYDEIANQEAGLAGEPTSN